MTEWTDLRLVQEHNKLGEFIFKRETEFKEGWHCRECGVWHDGTKKATTAQEGIKAELKARLIQRGADNTRTEAGTAYLSDHTNVTVTNRDALLAFAREHWEDGGGALVVIKPPVDAVKDWKAMHGDQLPPGIETSVFTRINIRGAK